MVGPPLQGGDGMMSRRTGGGGQEEEAELCYLLEDEERGEGPGNVQLDEVQTGLPVGQRRPL